MIKKISMDHPVNRVMGRFADLLVLNIMFLITCIPVVTIGAAQSALYAVTLKMVRGEESYIVKGYFKAFCGNFRQAAVIWTAALGMIFVMYRNFQLVDAGSMTRRVLEVICVLGVMMLLYAFPLTARFQNTVWNTLNNALLMSIRHLFYTVLMLAVTAVPVLCTFSSNQMTVYGIPFWIFIGFSATALVNSWFFRRIFAQYEDDGQN